MTTCKVPPVLAKRKRKRVLSEKNFNFAITTLDATIAKCGDPAACVVAQGILRSVPSGIDVKVFIGGRTCKIVTADTVTLYRTPKNLQEALRHFDQTGKWNLPPGNYHLSPYWKERKPTPAQLKKWAASSKKNKAKKGQDKFKSRATRKVVRVDQLVSVA